MRSVFTLLALLVALALVALLSRQQLAALRGPSPAAKSASAPQPGATVQTPRQMEQQVQQQVQELMQPRPVPEDAR